MSSLARAHRFSKDFPIFCLRGVPLRRSILFRGAMLTAFAALAFSQYMGWLTENQPGLGMLALMLLSSTLLELAMCTSLCLQGWLDPIANIVGEVSAYGLEGERVWKRFSKLSSTQLLDPRLDPLLSHFQVECKGLTQVFGGECSPTPLSYCGSGRGEMPATASECYQSTPLALRGQQLSWKRFGADLEARVAAKRSGSGCLRSLLYAPWVVAYPLHRPPGI